MAIGRARGHIRMVTNTVADGGKTAMRRRGCENPVPMRMRRLPKRSLGMVAVGLPRRADLM